MNFIGLVAAISAFLAVWFGHVGVRRIEYLSPNIGFPAAIFLISGLALEWLALVTPVQSASASLGIIGITFLWDTLELSRQARRVRTGHAPANPDNPRHAAILDEPGSRATTVNLLRREPDRT